MTLRSDITSLNFVCSPADQWWCGVEEQRLPAATWRSSLTTSGRGGVQCRFGCFDEHVSESFTAQRWAFHVAVSADPLRRLHSILLPNRRHRVGDGDSPSHAGVGVRSSGWAEVRLCSDEDDGNGGRTVGVEFGEPAINDAGQRRSTYDWEADDEDISTWIRDEAQPIKFCLYTNHMIENCCDVDLHALNYQL